MCSKNFSPFRLIFTLILPLQLAACGSDDNSAPQINEWPIAKDVFTTAEQQILPVALSPNTLHIRPGDVSLYEQYGYSAWQKGVPLPHEKRTKLAPGYTNAPNAARLLSFFAITDIHIADKESPAQPIYIGLSAAGYGSGSSMLTSAYSPIILSTIQVLDAAVQTINALHKKSPFDFGISLGDTINNTQYNEIRWYLDVLDGKVITPSSGAHAGADAIDYQQPFKAVGLNKTIPWFQVIGNHDQFWMGSTYENTKTRQAHVADTIINMRNDPDPASNAVNGTGAYMGVVDGSTPYGEIIGAGPEELFPSPPKVIADENRHSLATPDSSSLKWMNEFFNTTSSPDGHGFTQANLEKNFTCYSFEPTPGVPIKVIVLDDTCKGPDQLNYAAGCLDQTRIDWLKGELQKGQNEDKLMIIAAHIPILPQTSLTDTRITSLSFQNDKKMLADLHTYPNLLLWISGHRHMNVVTPQPNNAADFTDHPEQSFWEVETASLRDFPQQFRTFDIRRNSDNTVSIMITNVDPAVVEGSPAAKSRGYAIGAARIFGATTFKDTTSHAYNAELVKQLSPTMQAKIANYGLPIQ
jgi:metallophosphoesterase (TIGR03768 family)